MAANLPYQTADIWESMMPSREFLRVPAYPPLQDWGIQEPVPEWVSSFSVEVPRVQRVISEEYERAMAECIRQAWDNTANRNIANQLGWSQGDFVTAVVNATHRGIAADRMVNDL